MEIDNCNVNYLDSLVGSYEKLTRSGEGYQSLKDEKLMPKHNEAREKILDEIIKLLGGKDK